MIAKKYFRPKPDGYRYWTPVTPPKRTGSMCRGWRRSSMRTPEWSASRSPPT